MEAIEAEAPTPEIVTPPKLKVIRFLAFALVPALFMGFIAFTLFQTAPPDTLVGQKMPEFSLEQIGKEERLTSADLEGKAVVMNFWVS